MEKRNGTKFMIPIALVVGCLPWLILFGLFFVLIVAAIAGIASSGPSSFGGDQIALIHLSGVITAGQGGGGLFESSVGSERVINAALPLIRMAGSICVRRQMSLAVRGPMPYR